MGRAGSGGSSGGHSGGGHSSSRTSGGHHVSSGVGGNGHRPGQGSFHSKPGFENRGYRRETPPPPPPPPMQRGRYYGGRPATYVDNRSYYNGYDSNVYSRRNGGHSVFSAVVTILVMVFLMAAVLLALPRRTTIANTKNREKLDTGIGFNNSCIVDEIGWFGNIPQTERKLKTFFDETGVQPFVLFKAYDEDLQTDADKEAYAEEYYEENIDNESTFLFVYFGERDVDNDVGYMCYVNGKQVSSVMDAEAVDIFWSYVDNRWYSDMSTDNMIVSIFNSTANTIMRRTNTMADVGVKVGTIVIVIVVIGGVLIVMKTKRKHEHEKAEETERILNTPVNTIGDEDPLVSKYSDKNKT